MGTINRGKVSDCIAPQSTKVTYIPWDHDFDAGSLRGTKKKWLFPVEDEIAPISTSRVLTSTCLLLLWMSKKSSCSNMFPTLFRECRTTIEEKCGMCLQIGLCPKIVLLNGKIVINHWILRVSLKKTDKPSCHSCHSPTPPRFQGSLHTRTQQSVDEGRPRKLVSDIGTGKCRELAIEIGNHAKIPVEMCEIVENHGKIFLGKYPVSDSADMDMTRK